MDASPTAGGDLHPEATLSDYKPLFHPSLLAGKVAFVTGGGSGICFRITEMLMRHGCSTFIVSRSVDRVKAAAATLAGATGQRCEYAACDVRDSASVEAAVQACVDKLGAVDIVINGAAGNFLCHAGALSAKAFKTVMEIDTFGTFNVSRAAYALWQRDHGGCIINISATLYYRGDPMQAHAGAAKAAIDALTRHMGREWGPQGIRVNSIAPGPIDDTEGMRRLGGFLPKHLLEEFMSHIPAQRLGRRQDIGNAVLYLASDAGSYVTGHVLVVDGGAWMCDVSNDQLFSKL